jgi:hypothetical protein
MAGNLKGRRHYRMKVVPHRPGMQLLAVMVVSALVFAAIGAAYWFGYQQAAGELGTARQDLADFQRRAVRAESELSEVRERLTLEERTRLLDQQAAQNAQQLVSDLRQQISVIERDNALYRQVIGSMGQTQPELIVLRWDVMPTEVSGYFRYELDVAMSGAAGESAGILLDLDLLGEQQGQMVELGVLESQAVELKYLHRVSSFLAVPDGFSPDKVRIRVADRSARVSDIEFESQWVLARE